MCIFIACVLTLTSCSHRAQCSQFTCVVSSSLLLLFQIACDTQARPDIKLSAINLYGAPVRDVVAWLKRSRRRVLSSAGAVRLADDLSNLPAAARQMGWNDTWYAEKKRRVAKESQPPVPPAPLVFYLYLMLSYCDPIKIYLVYKMWCK